MTCSKGEHTLCVSTVADYLPLPHPFLYLLCVDRSKLIVLTKLGRNVLQCNVCQVAFNSLSGENADTSCFHPTARIPSIPLIGQLNRHSGLCICAQAEPLDLQISRRVTDPTTSGCIMKVPIYQRRNKRGSLVTLWRKHTGDTTAGLSKSWLGFHLL